MIFIWTHKSHEAQHSVSMSETDRSPDPGSRSSGNTMSWQVDYRKAETKQKSYLPSVAKLHSNERRAYSSQDNTRTPRENSDEPRTTSAIPETEAQTLIPPCPTPPNTPESRPFDEEPDSVPTSDNDRNNNTDTLSSISGTDHNANEASQTCSKQPERSPKPYISRFRKIKVRVPYEMEPDPWD